MHIQFPASPPITPVVISPCSAVPSSKKTKGKRKYQHVQGDQPAEAEKDQRSAPFWRSPHHQQPPKQDQNRLRWQQNFRPTRPPEHQQLNQNQRLGLQQQLAHQHQHQNQPQAQFQPTVQDVQVQDEKFCYDLDAKPTQFEQPSPGSSQLQRGSYASEETILERLQSLEAGQEEMRKQNRRLTDEIRVLQRERQQTLAEVKELQVEKQDMRLELENLKKNRARIMRAVEEVEKNHKMELQKAAADSGSGGAGAGASSSSAPPATAKAPAAVPGPQTPQFPTLPVSKFDGNVSTFYVWKTQVQECCRFLRSTKQYTEPQLATAIFLAIEPQAANRVASAFDATSGNPGSRSVAWIVRLIESEFAVPDHWASRPAGHIHNGMGLMEKKKVEHVRGDNRMLSYQDSSEPERGKHSCSTMAVAGGGCTSCDQLTEQ